MDGKRKRIPVNRILRNPICFLAFGFGSGLAPKAPGTVGTLVAVPLYLLLSKLSPLTYVAIVLLMFIIGVWLCGRCEQILETQDHSGIVWDEFVGLLITLAGIHPSAVPVVAGFVLFRAFDVFKPWPISWLDRHVHGGLGIMLDDALAGLFAWAILFALTSNGWLEL